MVEFYSGEFGEQGGDGFVVRGTGLSSCRKMARIMSTNGKDSGWRRCYSLGLSKMVVGGRRDDEVNRVK